MHWFIGGIPLALKLSPASGSTTICICLQISQKSKILKIQNRHSFPNYSTANSAESSGLLNLQQNLTMQENLRQLKTPAVQHKTPKKDLPAQTLAPLEGQTKSLDKRPKAFQ